MRAVLLAPLLVLLLVVPGAPATAGPARTAEECAAELDCSAAELEAIPMGQRVVFLRALQERLAADYIPGFRHWRNFEGLLRFFDERGYGARGSWISWSDAGNLEGIERGVAIALRGSGPDFGNPGAEPWADYLRRMHRGELADRATHDPVFADAEQASLEHGVSLAEARGAEPSRMDRNLYLGSELYRWMLRNPQPVLFELNRTTRERTGTPLAPADFYRWFTDVRESEPTYRGAHVIHDTTLPNPASAPISALRLLLAYLPELRPEAQRDVVPLGG
ncbi:hypothetical protein [Saccharopolyspora griseoalba]|uniref:Uncharacterized protein n=1 Tax=Saccharopolyspora griseoalba TaxID=1431848 RepID=A0ABW2LSY7_9PSEU